MGHSPIVFTDLDGSLLNHVDYGYSAARPALEYLRSRGIPLVLCTSKTAAEVLQLRDNTEFRDCAAIVENGAGVLEAGACTAEPSATHARLLSLLDSLPGSLRDGFSGFSSWDLNTLEQHTGLDHESARRAAMRDYSEPGLWLQDDATRQRFIAELGKLGITGQQGGRFLTLGFAANKADRMLKMIAAYRDSQNGTVSAIALGDAANDIEMLERADFGIVIPNPAHAGIPAMAGESQGCIVRAQAEGPTGWNDSLLNLLDDPIFSIPEA